MPRPYKLGRRAATVEETRNRIIDGARELIGADGFAAFTMDAVAERAGVARMTVYYQFGSRTGLLEALFDGLASRGLVERLRASFGHAEPFEALAAFIAAFVGFWASDRVVIRRLRSLAGLDDEVGSRIQARDARRRDGLRVIIGRFAAQYGRPAPDALDETIDVLHSLTSFETFDALAGSSRSPEDVATLLIRVARSVLGPSEQGPD
jgi:AcrR family transcriptional regulator